jgi:hypothetical protein
MHTMQLVDSGIRLSGKGPAFELQFTCPAAGRVSDVTITGKWPRPPPPLVTS